MVDIRGALGRSALPIACVVGVVGAGLTWVAFTGAPGGSPDEPRIAAAAEQITEPERETTRQPRSHKAKRHQDGVADLVTGLVLPESEPVAVSIPRLGVSSNLIDLSVDSTGAMEVPADPAVAGWYTLGPSPGALGPAVIAGHVTWDQAPAVFYRLGTLHPGDKVHVTREDGRLAVFSVQRVARFPKDQFPTQEVFGHTDHAGLRLITCGGKYDGAAQRYLDNVVVFAALADVGPRAG